MTEATIFAALRLPSGILSSLESGSMTAIYAQSFNRPKQDFAFYTELFRTIKAHRPELHIKALTPVEYHYIFKKAKLSYEEGMLKMKEAFIYGIHYLMPKQ